MPSSYNEYKYLVSNEKLPYIHSLLSSLLGDSDQFPTGVVDSIYYDTMERICYQQCADGEPQKMKFRIRGYGDGRYSQLHLKMKDLYEVRKLKGAIQPLELKPGISPSWDEVTGLSGDQVPEIRSIAAQFGPLLPALRVRYQRFRFRTYDYRLTLDTQIEAQGFSNQWDMALNHGLLPYHVLEIKTEQSRPHLPFFNLTQLPQISFSKFYLGSMLLADGDV